MGPCCKQSWDHIKTRGSQLQDHFRPACPETQQEMRPAGTVRVSERETRCTASQILRMCDDPKSCCTHEVAHEKQALDSTPVGTRGDVGHSSRTGSGRVRLVPIGRDYNLANTHSWWGLIGGGSMGTLGKVDDS